MTQVLESLLHCKECGNWTWWIKEGFPCCATCYPPTEPVERTNMSYKLQAIGQRNGFIYIRQNLPKEYRGS